LLVSDDMTEQLLVVENLQKHYVQNRSLFLRTQAGVVKAVDGVSFQVPVGATLGLVGESGCGKSTTARLLLRLEDPSGGRIQFDGKDVHDAVGPALRDYRTNVQAVFQDPYSSLNPRMRVAGIIAEPLSANRPVSKGELRDAVAQAMQTVGLNPHWAERFPHEFSGGQRQRIAIARSLILRPRLMILDEPVSALDVSIRAQILNLLMDLQEQFGLSYLLISHDLDVIAEMCNEIAVMYLGRSSRSDRPPRSSPIRAIPIPRRCSRRDCRRIRMVPARASGSRAKSRRRSIRRRAAGFARAARMSCRFARISPRRSPNCWAGSARVVTF
jgi:ABC-type oligopeptide transport system ATPase subunit